MMESTVHCCAVKWLLLSLYGLNHSLIGPAKEPRVRGRESVWNHQELQHRNERRTGKDVKWAQKGAAQPITKREVEESGAFMFLTPWQLYWSDKSECYTCLKSFTRRINATGFLVLFPSCTPCDQMFICERIWWDKQGHQEMIWAASGTTAQAWVNFLFLSCDERRCGKGREKDLKRWN